MAKSQNIIYPKPLLDPIFTKNTRRDPINRLLNKELVLLDSDFKKGLDLLDQLSKQLQKPSPTASYQERTIFEQNFRDISSYLLVPITKQKIKLKGASECGFLKEFYAKQAHFFLPFPQIEELSGAWKRYKDGLHFSVLGHRIHPFYGTYFPTRTSHLELFATWLHQYTGSKETCIDMGAGSGILSFLLERKGFQSIIAADSNPNALESIKRELHRHQYKNITPVFSDLFSNIEHKVDLIVFNPPWIVGEAKGPVSQALFSDEDLLERFFTQAYHHLKPNGSLVLIFSNIHSLLFPNKPHPLQKELEKERFHLKKKLQRKVKPPKQTTGKRRRTKEKVEIWEFFKK